MDRILLERQVLGRMLLSFGVLQLALRQNINASVFHGPDHAQIFDAIVHAHIEANGQADAIHVAEQLITDNCQVDELAIAIVGLIEASDMILQSHAELIRRLADFAGGTHAG